MSEKIETIVYSSVLVFALVVLAMDMLVWRPN